MRQRFWQRRHIQVKIKLKLSITNIKKPEIQAFRPALADREKAVILAIKQYNHE